MKNYIKPLILQFFCFFIFEQIFAQVSLSPWAGYNLSHINYSNKINPDGNIYLPYQEHTYALGANVNIPFLKKDKSYLISTGIHFTTNRIRYTMTANLEGINSFHSAMKWSNSFSQFQVPILFYKSFYFNQTKTGSISLFSGISLGISYQSRASYDATVNPTYMDNTSFTISTFNLNEKVKFMPSFTGGFDIAPFQQAKNLKFGFLTIVNLTESTSFSNWGVFENHTKNTFQVGSISANPVFYSFIFNIKYDFLIKPKALGNSKIKKFDDKSINY